MAVTLKLASEPAFTVNDDGCEVIVGAAFTVTFTDVLTVVYVNESVGVKVTDCEVVPTLGTVSGEVKANVPATDAEPPLNTEEERGCPDVIAEAVGLEITIGVAMFTVKLALTLVTLPAALLTNTL